MLLGDDSVPGGQQIAATMNVAGGFINDFSFYYAAIEASGQEPDFVRVFSGLNGTGSLLASTNLMNTGTTNPPFAFFTTAPVDMTFSGVAHSAVFTGGNQRVLFDNIGVTSIVPESGSFVLFAQGVALVLLGLRGRLATARTSRLRR
jgi:hypothetical protein